MPTLKKRINITLPKTIDAVLEKISLRDGVPVATKAVELLRVALEIEEDAVWDKIAGDRDNKKAKFVSHEEAWL